MDTNIIINTINILCGGIIIYYLFHLKQINCKCSLNYKRLYIFGFNIILIVYSLFFLFSKYNVGNFPILGLLLFIAEFISIIFTILFINDLKKQNCRCSVSLMRTIMFIIAIIQVCSWVLLLLFLLIIYLYFTEYKKLNHNEIIKMIK
uniref:Uncharacterized protein n=1 Tax=viral metagenome TaxID=1070528 RepID=A0A6C0ETK6_9ZZZZ